MTTRLIAPNDIQEMDLPSGVCYAVAGHIDVADADVHTALLAGAKYAGESTFDRRIIAKLSGVDLNTVAQHLMPMYNVSTWIARGMIACNANADCSSTVRVGAFVVATNAVTGYELVATSQALSGLSTVNKLVDLTLTSQTYVMTSQDVYFCVDIAAGAARTCDVYLLADVLK